MASMDTHYLDTGRMAGFICASAPEPMFEYQSTEPRKDRESGLPLFLVGVTVRNTDNRKAWVIDIQVPGEPVGLTEGTRVAVFDLTASPWDRDGRSGMTYRASAITAVTASAPAANPAASAPVETGGAGRPAGGKAAARE